MRPTLWATALETLHGCSTGCWAKAAARAVPQLTLGTIGLVDGGPTIVIVSAHTTHLLRNASISVIAHRVYQMGSETRFEPAVQLRLTSGRAHERQTRRGS